MVVYVNQFGTIREYSDISIASVKNGMANIVQHLTSTKDNVPAFERRMSQFPVLPGETRDDVANKLNENSNIIISSKGELTALKASV